LIYGENDLLAGNRPILVSLN